LHQEPASRAIQMYLAAESMPQRIPSVGHKKQSAIQMAAGWKKPKPKPTPRDK